MMRTHQIKLLDTKASHCNKKAIENKYKIEN